ncbi:S-DNA-T family DNA segregation ATPase FtsK/SpoIIIE [Curtobacterium herbarum]|uniref:FtsK/SpoIIIE domain-containing protein n=1 Tax=Curtobacterium herbarum TaxID=150122 RepID=UPI002646C07D|nr:FtsK/SpoIIIE domain-containing protein [Curtobacterium herbarum]MCP1503644.1 S-DNA-T family DNA segregation ATPase FtsK/SpoIIIE [Curtobacterium herbarum]
MQVVVTVVDDVTGVRSDVLIDAPGSATMRSVVDALSRRTGGTPLPAEAGDADVRFADSGLVDGAVLHIGADADTGAGRGLVDLLVAGGVGAGRCVRVGVGTVRLAFTPDSETLTGSETAGLPGLEARIAFDGTVTVRLAPALVAEPSPDPAPVGDAPEGAGTSGEPAAALPGALPPGALPPVAPAPGALSFESLPPGALLPGAVDTAAGHPDADPSALPEVTVDGERVGDEWTAWEPGAVLRVAETALTVRPVAVVDRMLLRPPDSGQLDFNRPPRLLPPLRPTSFRIPKPPVPPQRSALPWIMVFVPAMFGIVMATVFHSPFYLLFAFMTPIMVIGQTITARKTGKKSHRKALADHADRVRAIEDAVAGAVLAERDQRREDSLDAAALRITATTPTRRLWERRPTDADHLHVRVGIGDLPSTVTVEDDRDQDRLDQEPRWTRGVPVTVPLAEVGVVGIAGPGTWPRSIGRWLLGQLAVTQSPREVQFVVLTAQSAVPDWAWTVWLPHVRPTDGQEALALVGSDAETIGRRLAELTQILAERRAERQKNVNSRRRFSPEIVVVLDGARRLRAMPGVVGLLRDGPALGIRLICIDEEEWQLPEECVATVLHRSPTQLVLRRQMSAPVDLVLADRIEDDWFDEVARALSPLRDTSGSDGDGLVPDSARLLDVLDLPQPSGSVMASRWRSGSPTTSAVVGVGIDGPFALDLVRDGPHGLVAGTTGSGKSEFLQTLVASLAAANRPDRMTFVLVDYKGGAAFSVASDLPHTVGLVTDLDQHLVERALRSLRAELTRREHILAASGAKDIEDHEAHLARGGSGEQMPRLVLVIDEFAAMVTELPDFVAGLIGIAQRGRSLGVHLILATQRPGGVVGPDIRANTNLRVALRMTDGGESTDVIDVADAARIPKSVPGRAYARLGHSSVVPFQSARVGGRWAGEADTSAVLPFVRVLEWRDFAMSPPERPSKSGPGSAATDLSVLVGAMRDAREQMGIGPLHSPWLPPLPELLPLSAVASASVGGAATGADASADVPVTPVGGSGLTFTWGLEDLPDTQQQRAATVDLERFGHLYVVGAPGSGRSQALRTLAASAAGSIASSDLHLYVVDCGNGALASLQSLPHCGAVAQRTQVERASRLIERLTREMARRHDVIAAAGAANITEQRMLAAEADRLPHVLVLVDRWENFTTTLGEVDGGSLTEAIQSLLRDGTGAGIHVVISGDRTLLTSRMSTLTDDKIVMRLTDRLDYSLGGINHRQLPATIPPGRGFRADSGTELQFATLGEDVSGQGQTAAVKALARRVRADEETLGLPRIRPFRVDALPKDLDLDGALELDGAPAPAPMVAVTGIGGDDMSLQTVDLREGGGTFIVAGPSRAGRSTMVAAMARSLLAGGTPIVVFAPRPGAVRDLAGLPGVLATVTGDDISASDVEDLLGRPGVVLVVDDGELLIDCSAKAELRTFVRGLAENGQGLVLGGNTTGLAAGFGGWQVDAKKNRRGALLSPQDTLAGDLVGVRISRSSISSRVQPGTALVHLGTGIASTVQVPMVTVATRTGSFAVPSAAGPSVAEPSVTVSSAAVSSADDGVSAGVGDVLEARAG